MLEVTQFNRAEFEAGNPEIYNVCKDAAKLQEFIDSVSLQINNASDGTDRKPLYKAKAGFLFVKDAMDPNSELNKKFGGKDNVLNIRVMRADTNHNITVAYALKVPERILVQQRQAEEDKKRAEAWAKEEAEAAARKEEERKKKEAERAQKAKKVQAKKDREARFKGKTAKGPQKKTSGRPPYRNGQHARPKASP